MEGRVGMVAKYLKAGETVGIIHNSVIFSWTCALDAGLFPLVFFYMPPYFDISIRNIRNRKNLVTWIFYSHTCLSFHFL